MTGASGEWCEHDSELCLIETGEFLAQLSDYEIHKSLPPKTHNKKFREELIAHFPLIPHGLHRKQRDQ
jgi:hypothetical protein